jgi:hypothetical protein
MVCVFFLLRFCTNKCDVLAVKLVCQGGPPLGAPAESCFSSVVCCQIVIGKHSQPSHSLWQFAAPVSFRGNNPKPPVDLEQCSANSNLCCCRCCFVVVKGCSGSWPARLHCVSCANYLGCFMPRILCTCWSHDHSEQTKQAKALTSPQHTNYISKGLDE